MKVSLVIPAHNEGAYLGQCLLSALSQSVPFSEIIVVDNNSSDGTAEIAKSFGVKVLKQRHQGVVHARNLGFDSARAEILARVDADTILPTDWNARVTKTFAS